MDVALNWIAQGVVVAMAAAVGLRLIPLSRARARASLVWTAYPLVLALPATSPLLATVPAGPTDARVPATVGPIVALPETWWTSPAVWIGLWLVWSGVQTGRLAVGALALRDARRNRREASGRKRLTSAWKSAARPNGREPPPPASSAGSARRSPAPSE